MPKDTVVPQLSHASSNSSEAPARFVRHSLRDDPILVTVPSGTLLRDAQRVLHARPPAHDGVRERLTEDRSSGIGVFKFLRGVLGSNDGVLERQFWQSGRPTLTLGTPNDARRDHDPPKTF